MTLISIEVTPDGQVVARYDKALLHSLHKINLENVVGVTEAIRSELVSIIEGQPSQLGLIIDVTQTDANLSLKESYLYYPNSEQILDNMISSLTQLKGKMAEQKSKVH